MESRKHARSVFLTFAGLFLLSLGVLAWLVFRDGPPPDDAHLLPQADETTELPNPLSIYLRTVGITGYPIEFDPPHSPIPPKSTEEDLAAYRDLLNSNSASWRWPKKHLTDGAAYAFHREINLPLTDTLHRSLKHARSGANEEAIRLASHTFQLGHGMTRAGGDTFLFDASSSIYTQGLHHLGNLAKLQSWTATDLRQWLGRLSDLPPPGIPEFISVRKMDYLKFRLTLDEVFEPGIGPFVRSDPFIPSGFASNGGFQSTFKRNQTLQLRCLWENATLEHLKQGWLAAYQQEAMRWERLDANSTRRQALYTCNILGWQILRNHTRTNRDSLRDAMSLQALYEATRVTLALRIYELEQGRLPDQLSDLAPGILQDTPDDVFANAPLVWNREKNVVYSIGPDLISNNGDVSDEEDDSRHPPDIGVKYWWPPSSQTQ